MGTSARGDASAQTDRFIPNGSTFSAQLDGDAANAAVKLLIFPLHCPSNLSAGS